MTFIGHDMVGTYLMFITHSLPYISWLIGVVMRHSAKILASEYKLFREQTKRCCHKKDTFWITFYNSYISFKQSSFFNKYQFTTIYETQVGSCRLPYASKSHVVWLSEWKICLQIHLYHLVLSWLIGTKKGPSMHFCFYTFVKWCQYQGEYEVGYDLLILLHSNTDYSLDWTFI